MKNIKHKDKLISKSESSGIVLDNGVIINWDNIYTICPRYKEYNTRWGKKKKITHYDCYFICEGYNFHPSCSISINDYKKIINKFC